MTTDAKILDEGTSAIEASVAKIAAEFRVGFEKVAQVRSPAVALFGSARVTEDSAPYRAARAVGRKFGEAGWSVVTGGGGGVMEGAPNPYVDIGYTFEHFYARKVCFVRPSEGFVIFPGGFGTLDELYESLTLIQTGKIRHFPVVLFDSDYWGEMIDWIKIELLADGMISADDIELLHVTDDTDEAVQLVLDCYERRCASRPEAPEKEDAQ